MLRADRGLREHRPKPALAIGGDEVGRPQARAHARQRLPQAPSRAPNRCSRVATSFAVPLCMPACATPAWTAPTQQHDVRIARPLPLQKTREVRVRAVHSTIRRGGLMLRPPDLAGLASLISTSRLFRPWPAKKPAAGPAGRCRVAAGSLPWALARPARALLVWSHRHEVQTLRLRELRAGRIPGPEPFFRYTAQVLYTLCRLLLASTMWLL